MSAILPLEQRPFWPARQFSKDAVKLLISLGCGGLLLDPGLGKTAIALMSFLILKQQKINKRMLVITPLRPMAVTWPAEIQKWRDFGELRYAIVHGKDKEEMLDVDADIFLINPEAVPWLEEGGRYRRLKCDVLCVDESTKFKNGTSKRFKALRPMLNSFRRRWILTGTPTPNGLMDLFGQIYILDQGHTLGRFITHYRQRFFYPTGYMGYEWRLKAGADVEIAKLIDPMVLRLKAEDWIDMPELIHVDLKVELPPEARKIYREVEAAFITEIQDETIVAANTAVAGGKCRQIANGALYSEIDAPGTGKRTFHVIHDAKIEALRDLLDELQGQPLLILYEFDHDRQIIQKAFPSIPDIGSVSLAKSGQLIRDFNAGLIPAILGHPGSMGHGLNMQSSCNRVCYYGLTWNFEQYDQARRRVYRSGQRQSSVIVYHIVAEDTLDEVVADTLKGKDQTQATFMKKLRTFKR